MKSQADQLTAPADKLRPLRKRIALAILLIMLVLNGYWFGPAVIQWSTWQYKRWTARSWADGRPGFADLPPTQKNQIVWWLSEQHLFPGPQQKEICLDLIAHQGDYANANALSFTSRAVNYCVKQNWREAVPLLENVYGESRSVYIYMQSFDALRTMTGNPVSPEMMAAFQTLTRASDPWPTTVSDEALHRAVQLLARHPDREAVLVHGLAVATSHGGKGGTDRGQKAGIEVLKSLDPGEVQLVARRIWKAAQQDPFGKNNTRGALEWMARALGIELKD